MNRTKNLLVAAAWVATLAAGMAPAGAALAAEARPLSKTASAWTTTVNKHNGSGIRFAYIAPAMQPGRTGTVQLQFSGVQADDASVEWRAPEGGSVSSATLGAASSMVLPKGQVTTLTLDVTPGADGMAYLDVFTVQNGRGSAHSVPLKVGTGKVHLKREGTLRTTPSGESVISLPSTPK